MGAPKDRNGVYDIYVPVAGSIFAGRVAPTSAIVGSQDRERGLVHCYFEGNLHGAENLKEFSDRVKTAAGRLVSKYPTVAHAWCPKEELIRVGSYNTKTEELLLNDLQTLAKWLGT